MDTLEKGLLTADELAAAKKKIQGQVKEAVSFADASPMPPVELAKELEFPTKPDTDYNQIPAPAYAAAVNARTISEEKMRTVKEHIAALPNKGSGLIAE